MREGVTRKEDIAGTLMAISLVTKDLAEKVMKGEEDERNKRGKKETTRGTCPNREDGKRARLGRKNKY